MTIEERVPLARFSTLHVGGPARYFARVAAIEDAKQALAWAEDKHVSFFILGGGSNLLVRDEGFPGLVVKMENRAIGVSGKELSADAGAIMKLAVGTGVRRGARGIEHLAGIPGTIGGAVRGNAGSFGTETKDRLARVDVLHRTARGWEEETLPRESLSFGYRDSTFKRDPSYVVWRATFTLDAGDPAEGERLLAEDFAARKAKQPYEFPSVGSVFKNPRPDLSAGTLSEEAGCKGVSRGGAEVSTKHANFIVNRGKATAADVLGLIEEVKKRVFEKSGVRLEEEIVILG